MAWTSPPALVSLRLLCTGLCVLALATATACLLLLYSTEQFLETGYEKSAGDLARMDDLAAQMADLRLFLHSTSAGSPAAHRLLDAYEQWSDGMHGVSPTLPPSFFDTFRDRVVRLEKLHYLAAQDRERGSWEDLQIILREAERAWEELSALLVEGRSNIYEDLAGKMTGAGKTLRIVEGLLALNLLVSAFAAGALYLQWRGLEKQVLGIRHGQRKG